MPRLLLMCGLLAGCGLTESSYQAEKARLDCAREQECVPVDPAPDCANAPAPPQSSIIQCTFQADEAQACLDAIPSAPCNAVSFDQPAACSRVLVDCTNGG